MVPALFQFESLFNRLRETGYSEWADELQHRCAEALNPARHGHLADWSRTWQELPDVNGRLVDTENGLVTVVGEITDDQKDLLRAHLKTWHPWRKGPFDLFGIHIDTEWRSDWKWNRLRHHVDFRGRTVLDVGCGNGYYGFRMLQAGAELVMGLDPLLLYVMQHEVIKRYAGRELPSFVLPSGDDCLPTGMPGLFDVVSSMGVLYHRTSPVDHLQALAACLKSSGQLLLETLIIQTISEIVVEQSPPDVKALDRSALLSDIVQPCEVLVPAERYAMMRNVWFIPSIALLKKWLQRTGFTNVKVVSVCATTTAEQRRTEWMTFESLADFLDPENSTRTIEGYPGPVRAVVTAQRR